MKPSKNRNVLNLLKEIEGDLQGTSNLPWIKRLKERVEEKLKQFKELTKKEALSQFKDDLIKLDKSIHEDEVFINKLRTKINGTRKRKAS